MYLTLIHTIQIIESILVISNNSIEVYDKYLLYLYYVRQNYYIVLIYQAVMIYSVPLIDLRRFIGLYLIYRLTTTNTQNWKIRTIYCITIDYR